MLPSTTWPRVISVDARPDAKARNLRSLAAASLTAVLSIVGTGGGGGGAAGFGVENNPPII